MQDSAPELPNWVLIAKELGPIVAGLWQLAGVLIVGAFLIYFRKGIGAIFERGFKFKALGTEAEIPPQIEREIGKPLQLVAGGKTDQPPTEPTVAGAMEDGETRLHDAESPPGEPTTADEWRAKMTSALVKHHTESAEHAYAQLITLVDPSELLEEKAFYLYMRYRHLADSSALTDLHKVAEDSMDPDGTVHFWIGHCYAVADLDDKAIDPFRVALSRATNDNARVLVISAMSRALHRLEKTDAAQTVIEAALNSMGDPSLRSRLYELAADLFKDSKDFKQQAFSLEKALENRPNDLDLTFNLAFAYSQAGMAEMAMLHYEQLLEFSPENTSARNNLGVAYQALDLKILGVESYSRSADAGHTLAMSNLAGILIGAGFEKNARELLVVAQGKPEPHENVSHWLTQLNQAVIDEKELRTAKIKRAMRRKNFFRMYVESRFRPMPPSSTRFWKLAGTTIEIDTADNFLFSTWTGNGKRYTLTAPLHNGAGEFKIKSKYENPTILTGSPSTVEGYLYFSSDGRINMIETGDEDSFSTLEPVIPSITEA